MKIYTKSGDEGETGLFGGERVRKDSRVVAAYGTVDEANAAIGSARAAGVSATVDETLRQIQSDLFVLGAELASSVRGRARLKLPLLAELDVERLEQTIDRFSAELPGLKHFVLPAGALPGALLHLARTVCRRAERLVVAVAEEHRVRGELVRYLNRLSDLLFVLARHSNQQAGVNDEPWRPRAGS